MFGLTENNDLFPVRVSEEQRANHIQLLYISNNTNSHYVLIKSLSSLVYHQISKHKEQKWFCENCLNAFSSARVRDKHFLHCNKFDPVRSVFPKPGENVLEFNKYAHQMAAPYFIVADIESLQVHINDPNITTGPNISSTSKYKKHVAHK